MISTRNLVEVGISMVLQDQFSATSSQIAGSFGTMMNQINTAAQAAQGTWKPLINMGTGILKSYAGAFREFADVQNEMFLVQKMSGASAEQLKELTRLTRDINMEVPLTAQDISSAERYLAMAGNSAQDIKNLIRPVAQLSSVLGVAAGEKGGTADMLTNIMKMFQLPTETASSIADDLYSAVTNSNMSLSDLQDAFKYAGAEAHASGISMQETAAAIGLLGDIGIQGSSAGTALANSLRYLKQSVTGYKKGGLSAMNALGITPEDIVDAKGNLKSLSTVYETFFEAAKRSGYGNVELTNLFNQIFGVRGNRNILSVVAQLGDQNNAYYKILEAVNSNEGLLAAVTEERLSTAQGRIDQLNSAINNFKQGIGEAVEGPFKGILQLCTWIMGFLYKITQTGMGQWIVRWVAIQVAVGLVVNSIKVLRTFFIVLNGLATQFNASSNGTTGAIGRSSGQAAMLEWHLRRCLFYMKQMSTMQMLGMMGPGMKYNLGNGYVYGIGSRGSRKGMPFVQPVNAQGRTIGRPSYDPSRVQNTTMYGIRRSSVPGTPHGGGRIAPAPAPKAGGGRTGFLRGAMGALGTGAMAFMGGPLGLAMGIGITLLPTLIDALSSNTSAQEEANRQEAERLQQMSVEEYRKEKEIEQIKLLRAILDKLGENKEEKPIQVVINGIPIDVVPGEETNLSDLFPIF